jgi:hypothetical protein
LLTGCSQPPVEEAITQAITDMARAIEQRQTGTVMDGLHPELQISERSHGTVGRDEARRLLMAVFYRHRNINIILTNIQVTPDSLRDDRATARFNALVTGGSGGLLPDRAQLYRIDSDWQYDGDWKLISLQALRALEQ